MGYGAKAIKYMEENPGEPIPGYIARAAVATGLLRIMLVSWDIMGQAMRDIAPAGALFGFMFWAVAYVPGTFVNKLFENRNWSVMAIGAGYLGIMAVLWGMYVGIFSTL
jgi:hypothetical protein